MHFGTTHPFNPSSVIAQRYNVQSSAILQYVDRHGLDTDYERLSDLSRELGLDSETLPQYARAGQIPQAVKRAGAWMIHRHFKATLLERYTQHRITRPNGLLTRADVAKLFGVCEQRASLSKFLIQTGLDKARRFKYGSQWLWNPGDVHACLKRFRPKNFVTIGILEYLRVHGTATSREIIDSQALNPNSVRNMLCDLARAGKVVRCEFDNRLWKLTREGKTHA